MDPIHGSDLLGKGEVPPSPAPRSICEPSDTADTTLPPFAAHITSHRRRRRRCIPNPRPHWPVCRTPPPGPAARLGEPRACPDGSPSSWAIQIHVASALNTVSLSPSTAASLE
ncbi:hypothetical protein PCL_03053 [Purpureocillium lilacinum]|uniref:Uncharacterized protein n=1 Tax=Purpureocillium lilacinum TaxID=33203 RepID=A0A2U3DYF3_PURLI|nr:hypothetical protein Purlil1_492 [Purpureocillium lilacinum]PWI67285.1 hypothetical protein PCL_03053 [Purpureocillium lilacinum]